MTHHSFKEDLLAWIDGELTATRRKKFAAHRSSCSDCRRQENLIRSVMAAVPPAEPVSAGFTVRLLARIERERFQGVHRAPFLPRLIPPHCLARAVAFASCAVLLAGSVFLAKRMYRQTGGGPDRTEESPDRCLSASCGAS